MIAWGWKSLLPIDLFVFGSLMEAFDLKPHLEKVLSKAVRREGKSAL